MAVLLENTKVHAAQHEALNLSLFLSLLSLSLSGGIARGPSMGKEIDHCGNTMMLCGRMEENDQMHAE